MTHRALPANLVLAASAGTGKTFRLVKAALELLIEDGVPVDRVVALTFTEMAANEMKERLLRRLDALRGGGAVDELGGTLADAAGRWGLDEPALLSRVRKALAGIEQMPVGTIHSFAARLLRRFPREAGVLPAFEAVREIPEEIFDAEWERWARRALGPGAPPGIVAILDRLRVADLRELAYRLSDFLMRLPIDDRNALVELRREAARSAGEVATTGLRSEHRKWALDVGREILTTFGVGNDVPPALRRRRWLIEDHWPDKLPKALRELVLRVLDVQPERLDPALRELSTLAESVRARCRREGRLPFNALLVLARDLLRDSRSVRRWAKAAFDAILVDEFQDTDPIQYEIILFLAEDAAAEAPDARRARLAPGKLLVVGDEKQSIYAFRGADLEAYRAVVAQVEEQGAAREPLQVSRRSQRPILDFVNAVFARLWGASYPPLAPLAPPPGARGPSKVELVAFEGGLSDEVRPYEAAWIARWVRDRVKAGTPAREVAVLLRAMTDAHVYAGALRSEGLRVFVEGEKHFYETQEVTDVANFLRVLANPYDEVATVGLLRSAWGGLTDDEIFEAKREAGGVLTLARAGGRLPEEMERLRRDAAGMRVGDLVEALYERFDVPAAVAATEGGEQALANVLRAAAMARGHRGTLGAFVRDLVARLDEGEEEAEGLLADPGVEAVRLMTMHKAKGLEFEAVVVADLSRKFQEGRRGEPIRCEYHWGEDRVGVVAGGLSNAAAVWAERRRARVEEEERLRLLYVAMTRAKERLLLTGRQAKDASYMKLLAGLDDLPAERTTVEIAAEPEPKRGAAASPIGIDEAKHDAAWARWEESAREARKPRVTLPSKLGEAVELSALATGSLGVRPASEAIPPVDGGSRAEPAPGGLGGGTPRPTPWEDLTEGVSPRAREIGTICHAVLERVDPGDAAGTMEAALAASADDAGIAAEARGILAGFFRSAAWARIAGSKILGREVPFVYEEGGGLVVGAIDLICQRDGRIVVADYKTDRVDASAARERAAAYAAQGQAYVEACRRRFPGRDIAFEVVFVRAGVAVEVG